MSCRPRVVVFCDLDSLLIPYPLHVGGPNPSTLEHLHAAGVVLVLCSRRTRAELDWFLQQLRTRGPFVAEHGSAMFAPGGHFGEVPGSRSLAGYDVVEFGCSYTFVVDSLRKTAIRLEVPIRTMADMSIEEASHKLGVPLPVARLTKLRDHTELFQVDESDRERLFRGLRSVHLHCTRGERLDHVGATVDASLGVALLRTLYRRANDSVLTIGIADASAEPDVLRLVDYPVTVSSRVAGMLTFPSQMIEHSARLRSAGAAALVDTVNDIVVAVRNVGLGCSLLVNERSV